MVEAKKHILTSQGMQALEDELQDLKVVKRKEIAQKIKEAREQGDLSENAEYDAAKDEQRSMEARIEELEKIIKNAEVIDESAYDKDTVSIGSTVKFYDEEFDEELEYRIVGSTESDILKGLISNESPLGKGLIGAKIGDSSGRKPRRILSLQNSWNLQRVRSKILVCRRQGGRTPRIK